MHDQNGSPINGGCRRDGAACSFAHPGVDPEFWDLPPVDWDRGYKKRNTHARSGTPPRYRRSRSPTRDPHRALSSRRSPSPPRRRSPSYRKSRRSRSPGNGMDYSPSRHSAPSRSPSRTYKHPPSPVRQSTIPPPPSPVVESTKDPRKRPSTPSNAQLPTGPSVYPRATSAERMPPPPPPPPSAATQSPILNVQRAPPTFVPAQNVPAATDSTPSSSEPSVSTPAPAHQVDSNEPTQNLVSVKPPNLSPPSLPPPPPSLNRFLPVKSGQDTASSPFAHANWGAKVQELSGTVSIHDKRRSIREQMAVLETMHAKGGLPDKDRALVEDALKNLQAQDAEQNRKLSESEIRLRNIAAMPELPGTVKRRLDILEHLSSLQKTADGLLVALQMARSSGDPTAPSSDAMDVDESNHGPPLKRRRTEDSTDSAPISQETLAIEAAADIKREVLDLDTRIDAIREQCVRMEDSIEGSLSDEARNLFDEYIADRSDANDPDQVAERVKDASDRVDGINKEMDELSETMETLFKKDRQLDGDIRQARGRNEELSNEIRVLTSRLNGLAERRAASDRRLSALETALEAHIESPAPTATNIPLEYILSAIQGPIEDVVQQSIDEAMEVLRESTERYVNTETQRLYRHVWEKTKLLRNVSTLIINRMPKTPSEPAPIQ